VQQSNPSKTTIDLIANFSLSQFRKTTLFKQRPSDKALIMLNTNLENDWSAQTVSVDFDTNKGQLVV
jgi:hypothetical protein